LVLIEGAMLKLGKLTDYGTVIMTVLAGSPAAILSAQDIAMRAHLTLPTVAKLLKQLVRAGLVQSQRGAHGGYRLARDPSTITVADVVVALEGPVALTECSGEGSGCQIQTQCETRTNWQAINQAIAQALASVTLAQMLPPRRAREPHAAAQAPHEYPLVRAT
jgi:FeS assembly SUF system regulator